MADLSLQSRPQSELRIVTDMRAPLHVRSSSSPISEILTFNEDEDDEAIEEDTKAIIPTPGVVVVKKQKRKRWKKPADHPKRPLSAYNLFFQWGRERLLSGESLIPLQQDDIDQIDVDTRRNSKRRHRREHGVIGFTELAKMLGTKWKELDPDSKEMFQKRADVEKARYERAVCLYKAEKGENPKDDERLQRECETPMSSKPKKLAQPKGKKIDKDPSTTTKAITTDGSSQQQRSLREEAETLQPLTYDASNAMYRPMGGSQSNYPGLFSSLFRDETTTTNELYYSYFDNPVFQSGHPVHPQEMSVSAQSNSRPSFPPQTMINHHPNYIQSNSAVGSGSSIIRDYNETSMGPMQGMLWNTGSIPNHLSSPAFHSQTNSAYNHANYFDPSTRNWPAPCTNDPSRSYYNTMPPFGQQQQQQQLPLTNNTSGTQHHQSMQNSPYPQYPTNPLIRYPSCMEPFHGPTPMNPVHPSPMHHPEGMERDDEDVDGLSSTSPLLYFE